ncbi:MAG: hypothetical protein WCT12_12470 [Verrucomicrobiota bacterium]
MPPVKPQSPFLPGLSIMDVCGLSVGRADDFFARLKLTEFQEKIAHDIIKRRRSPARETRRGVSKVVLCQSPFGARFDHLI